MAYCGLSAVKYQHHVADMAHPPHLEQQEKRASTDIKHVPPLVSCFLCHGVKQESSGGKICSQDWCDGVVIVKINDECSLFIIVIKHFRLMACLFC